MSEAVETGVVSAPTVPRRRPGVIAQLDPRRHLSPQVKDAIKGVLLEARIAHRHRTGIAMANRLQANDRINVGCGPNQKPGWVNVDLFAPGDVVPLDLRRPLPFPDNSADQIYGEHVFEHLAYPGDTGTFLRESLRVLRPGGLLSIGVPDAARVLQAYVTGDAAHFAYTKARWHPDWCDTYMHQVNYAFRQGTEHKYAYDEETLCAVMTKAGFGAYRRSFDPSLDSEERAFGTLYVDGIKPQH